MSNNLLKEKERIYLNDKCLTTSKGLLNNLSPQLFKKRTEVMNNKDGGQMMAEDDIGLDMQIKTLHNFIK